MPEVILPCPNQKCGSVDNFCMNHVVLTDEYCVTCKCGVCGPHAPTRETAIAEFNALPRALTWTHEPPKVAGWYWMRRKLHGKWRNRGIVHIYMDFAGTKTLQAKGWGRQVGGLENMGIDFEWAGPIPLPMEG